MLIELRDVEVHIQPDTVLVQALEEGDISTDLIISECISNDGVEKVLDAIDNDDIIVYSKRTGLSDEVPEYDEIVQGINELTQTEKANLLWLLLKG